MKAGFTLLEMLIVLIVLALFMLLTIPNIHTVLTIVQKKGCEAQVSVIDAAILQYQLLHDQLPATIHDLITSDLILENQQYCQDGRKITIENNQATIE